MVRGMALRRSSSKMEIIQMGAKPIFNPQTSGATFYDDVSGSLVRCDIPGARYGIVNGQVTQFAANQPAIEDEGLRGCPAFTSTWFPSSIGPDVSHTIENGWNKATLIANGGGFTFVRTLTSNAVVGEVSVLQAVIKKGTARYVGFRAKRTSGVATVAAVFDFNAGDFTELNTHEKVFVKKIDVDTYHICLRYVAPDANGAFVGMSLCTSNGTEISTGGTIGQYVYFKSLTTTIGISINSLGQPNPTSSTSYVAETATATTGMSFDLDAALMSRLKNSLRGVGVGPNLWWGTPTITTPPWSDSGTHYVCDGTNNSSVFSKAGAVDTGKLYEITFTTEAVTSGVLWVYLGGILVFNRSPTANTTYTLRTSVVTTGSNVTFTNVNAFIGQIRKDIVVKEVQAQGHLKLEFLCNFDSEWLANSTFLNVFSASNNPATESIYFLKTSTGLTSWRIYDGTNNAEVQVSETNVGQSFKIILDWGYLNGALKMRLTVNGVKSSIVNFSGSFGTQDLRFFYGNTINAGWIKNIKLSPRPIW